MDGASAGIMEETSAKPRKACVRLMPEQRAQLEQITRNGRHSAKRIGHARVLLMADEEHPLGRYTDEHISKALSIHVKTVSRIRKAFVGQGLAPAIERRRRLTPPVEPKLDGKAEARLVAICCSPAPAGRARWTLSLLAEELVKRQLVVSICAETVRKTLKKTNCSLGV
jgi:transposase